MYEDIATKFFEHFIAIADAINFLGGTGLWDEEDGFYYDKISIHGHTIPLKTRSMVGIVPLLAVEILEQDAIDRLPGFRKRMNWFLKNSHGLETTISLFEERTNAGGKMLRLLAIPSRDRLARVLRYVFDESEFLAPHGIRSLSRIHAGHPYQFKDWNSGAVHEVRYTPGESDTWLFGGNSNWRGPIWYPINFLFAETLERYHHFYGDDFKVEIPTGSGRWVNLKEASRELARRMVSTFLSDASGRRPVHGDESRYAADPAWKDLILFYEYFHGETGRGVGASHQTGWTALVTTLLRGLL
ncbi:hypothetical protein HZA57_07555 [Candidatus Poribacteria bacterium]|nr:hypothetical protein [Candidatus Poribacteria bacterium]